MLAPTPLLHIVVLPPLSYSTLSPPGADDDSLGTRSLFHPCLPASSKPSDTLCSVRVFRSGPCLRPCRCFYLFLCSPLLLLFLFLDSWRSLVFLPLVFPIVSFLHWVGSSLGWRVVSSFVFSFRLVFDVGMTFPFCFFSFLLHHPPRSRSRFLFH